WTRSGARPPGAADLPSLRRPRRGGDGVEDLCHRHAVVQSVWLPGRVRLAAAAGRVTSRLTQPTGFWGGDTRLLVQYRYQLYYQYQLAGLRRRDDYELPDADAGSDRTKFRLCGNWDGGAGGVHPRLSAPHGADHRQLLGRPDPQHALHPAAHVAGPSAY